MHFLGAVQGVFLAAILASRRRNTVANKVLAGTMLVFSLDLIIAVYHAAGYDAVFPHLIGIDFGMGFLYGPLFYLYARILSQREQTFRQAYFLHFLPFALLLVYLVPFYAQTGAEKLALLRDPAASPWSASLHLINNIKLIHALSYVGAVLMVIKHHRERIKDTFSSIDRIHLAWLRNLMVGIVAVAVVAVVAYLLSLRNSPGTVGMGMDPNSTYDDYTLLCTALYVYAIGYLGLRQPEVFEERPGEPALEPAPAPAETSDDTRQETPDPNKPRYAKSGMDPVAAREYTEALLHLMDTGKPYRKGNLTLQDLSDALSISSHNLTEVINTQLGQNFYDFVNGYRVREVQERLADPHFDHLTILAIALEAGFNSKSSFNAVFKKHAKMTPSQYRTTVSRPA